MVKTAIEYAEAIEQSLLDTVVRVRTDLLLKVKFSYVCFVARQRCTYIVFSDEGRGSTIYSISNIYKSCLSAIRFVVPGREHPFWLSSPFT